MGSAGKSQPQWTASQTSAGPAATNTTITSHQQPSVPTQVHSNNAQRLSAFGEKTIEVATASTAPIKEGPVKVELPVFKPKNECNVIKIIQKEWDREVDRLDQKKLGKRPAATTANEKSIVQSGHAEIESNKVLYIYGNALEVLQRSEFYDQVEEMHLIYVRFDLIVYHQNLEKLKRFTRLKKLVMANNYLNSFILLSKIECLNTVEQIQIYDNEVLRCLSIKSFLVYRF